MIPVYAIIAAAAAAVDTNVHTLLFRNLCKFNDIHYKCVLHGGYDKACKSLGICVNNQRQYLLTKLLLLCLVHILYKNNFAKKNCF